MSGGMLSAKIEMCFTATGQSSMMREAGLYEADMNCNAILGFPFLFKEAWLVDARRQCLMERGHNKLGISSTMALTACHPTQRHPTLIHFQLLSHGYTWMIPIGIMRWTGVSFTHGC